MTPGILPVNCGRFRALVFSYGPNGVICAPAGIAGVAKLAAFFRGGDDRLARSAALVLQPQIVTRASGMDE